MKVLTLKKEVLLLVRLAPIQTSLELSYSIKKTLPEIQAETGSDVHLNITADEVLELFEQNPNEYMTLPDFLIMEKYLFEKFGIHISDWKRKSGQWLNTKSGTRLVLSSWDPDDHKLDVVAINLDFRFGDLGVRPSRCFW